MFQKVAVVDIDEQAGQDFVAKLNETYNNSVIFVKCDVSKEPEIDHCFNIVVKEFGNVDVLINNAGIMSDLETTWRLASDVNYVRNWIIIKTYILLIHLSQTHFGEISSSDSKKRSHSKTHS